MEQNFQDLYNKKTDLELYEIFSGKNSESYKNKKLAENILSERGFDFNNIDAYKSKFELEKLLKEIEDENTNWLRSSLFSPNGSFVFGFIMILFFGLRLSSLLRSAILNNFENEFDLILSVVLALIYLSLAIVLFRFSYTRKKAISRRQIRIDELKKETNNN